jgi:hypothetical protein
VELRSELPALSRPRSTPAGRHHRSISIAAGIAADILCGDAATIGVLTIVDFMFDVAIIVVDTIGAGISRLSLRFLPGSPGSNRRVITDKTGR